MNITEFMSFDLEWFTTVPGILITGGVVVLLIALILFITSNKKDKNKNQEVASEEIAVSTESQTPLDMAIDNNATVEANDVMSNQVAPVNNNEAVNNDINVNGTFGMNPSQPVANEIPTIPTATSGVQPGVNNVVDFSSPVMDTPVVSPTEVVIPVANNNVLEATPYVAPTIANVTEPTANPVVQNVPVVNNPVSIQEQPVIYGGANPANVNSSPVQERPVIYGGANPLENTTTLPRMTNHEAYGVSGSNVVQPAVETQPPVIETPVVESVVVPVEPISPVMEMPSVPPVSEPVVMNVQPVVPQVEIPVQTVSQTPTVPSMPMTGAEMFAGPAPENHDVIETLEF
jgi:hypothetical protein